MWEREPGVRPPLSYACAYEKLTTEYQKKSCRSVSNFVTSGVNLINGVIPTTGVSKYACSLLNVLTPKSAGDWLCQGFQWLKHKVAMS